MARLLPVVTAIVLSVGVIGSSLYVIVENFHPVMYKDMWYMLELLRGWQSGGSWPSMLWAPWGEHRILFPKILYLIDFRIGAGTGALLVALNLVLQAGVAFLWMAALRHSTAVTRKDHLILSAFAWCAGFWLVQSGNLQWGFQVAWYLNAFAVALAAYLVAGFGVAGSEARRWLRLTSAAVGVFVATYSLANGLLAWGVLFVALWKAGATPRHLAFWLGGACLAAFGQLAGNPSVSEAGLTDLRVIPYFLALLGNPVTRVAPAAGVMLGAIGSAIFLVLAARFIVRRSSDFFSRYALTMAAYVFISALVIAVGRCRYGFDQASSSRYYSLAILFWFALLAWVWIAVARWPRLRFPLRAAVFCGVALLVVAGQWSSVPERRIRSLKADLAALSLGAGVLDKSTLRYIHHHPDSAAFWDEDAFLRTQRLSIYKTRWMHTLGRRVDEAYRIDSTLSLRASLREVASLADSGKPGRFLVGAMTAGAGSRMPIRLLVVEEGRVTGFAGTHMRGCAGCFSGYARGLGAGDLMLYGIENEDAMIAHRIRLQ